MTDVKISTRWRQSDGTKGETRHQGTSSDGWQRIGWLRGMAADGWLRRRWRDSTADTNNCLWGVGYAPHSRVHPLMQSTTNEIVTTSKRLETTRDGIARQRNVKRLIIAAVCVKEMRVAFSNETWTESQRFLRLPPQNVQHVENLPTDHDWFLRPSAVASGFVSDNWRQHTMIGGKFNCYSS